jgi:hypothetical protein
MTIEASRNDTSSQMAMPPKRKTIPRVISIFASPFVR